MSQITIVVPPLLRHYVGQQEFILVEVTTVYEAIAAFAALSNDVRDHLFDHNGDLQRFIRVLINGELATMKDSQEETLAEGTELKILLPIAGG